MLHFSFIKSAKRLIKHLLPRAPFACAFNSGSLFNRFEASQKKSTVTATPFKREAKREMKSLSLA